MYKNEVKDKTVLLKYQESKVSCPVTQWFKHGASNAKVMSLIPGITYTQKQIA